MENSNKKKGKMISKKRFMALAEINDSHCVSIYIPTHRYGKETIQGKDSLNLKNQLKDIKLKLELQGMKAVDIETFTKPITDLIDDRAFWVHQSDGLALFLSSDIFHTFTLPINFEAFNYVSNEFYLKPVIPFFNGDGIYYLLTLTMDDVKFYEGTRNTLTEIEVSDLIPSQLQDSVGYDFEDKGLQFRTQQGNNGAGSFHGHRDASSVRKTEMSQFFRDIDNGLMKMLHDDQTPPLIICALDFHYSVYKEVNTYQNLFPEYIAAHPNDKDINQLHEESWELIKPFFSETREAKLDEFDSLIGTGKASSEINDIFPAALNGRIDTLFLEKHEDIYGTINLNTQDIEVEEELTLNNISLMNLLAMTVLKTSGKVYLLDKEKMPLEGSKAMAVFRY
jgi:hypothetical protein